MSTKGSNPENPGTKASAVVNGVSDQAPIHKGKLDPRQAHRFFLTPSNPECLHRSLRLPV